MLAEQVAVLDDKRAFKELFRLYYTKLQRFAYAITRDAHLAEEVVADVFVNLWKNRTRLVEINNLTTYLYIATKNIAIRSSARLNRLQQLNIADIEIAAQNISHNPEEILLSRELLKQYEEAVMALPKKCRTIYRLAKQDGLRYKEIAAILNISVKTVDAQLAIAIRRITHYVRAILNEN